LTRTTQKKEEEEDLTHISKAEDEESLSYPLQDQKFHPTPDSEQPPIDTSNIEPNSNQKKSNRKTNSTEAPPIKEVNMMATTKPGVYLEDYADGQIVGVYPLPSGWDGTFKIGDDQQSVIMTTKIPRSIYNAQTILQCHGFDDNNIHVVSLQAAMNKAKKATV
jgi:hypothetical protein